MSEQIAHEAILDEKPLVTFALFAYNQERFIREAVAGALAQDYSPLEIILSDDCSEDRTFEIMQEMAARYIGPHRLILNRNASNLGLGGHVNRVVELAEGELIVGAAGDDISLPQRTTELADAWIKIGKTATSIHSAVMLIDENSNPLGARSMYSPQLGDLAAMSFGAISPYGAAHAFSRQLMLDFGKLDPGIVYEDQVIGYRSALVGGFEYVSKQLVKYRVNQGAACSGLLDIKAFTPDQVKGFFLRDAERACVYRNQNLVDASKVLGERHPVIDILRKVIEERSAATEIYCADASFFHSTIAALKACRRGARLSVVGKDYIKSIIWPIYARYYDLRRRIIVGKNRSGDVNG